MKIFVSHGESGTLFYVVDETAPVEEQPAIVASFGSREEAEKFLKGTVPFVVYQTILIGFIAAMAMTFIWSLITLIGG